MNSRMVDYLYIAATIAFTVYGQLIIKWRVGFYGQMPVESLEKIKFIIAVLLDPWVLTGLAAAFVASFAWIAAMSKFELSHAYPFMSLNFVVVLLLSGWLLNEPMTVSKTGGVILIIIGTMVASRG